MHSKQALHCLGPRFCSAGFFWYARSPRFLSVQLFLRSLNGEFSSIILYLQTLLTGDGFYLFRYNDPYRH